MFLGVFYVVIYLILYIICYFLYFCCWLKDEFSLDGILEWIYGIDLNLIKVFSLKWSFRR